MRLAHSRGAALVDEWEQSEGEEVIGDLGCQDGSVCGKSGNGGIEVILC